MFDISPTAVQYAWKQLCYRAGVVEADNLPFFYGDPYSEQVNHPTIIVCRSKKDAWVALLNLEKQNLNWFPIQHTLPPKGSVQFKNSIPVLLWGDSMHAVQQPFAEQLPNGSIVFYADILASVLFMLTRWEEMTSTGLDRHQRFSASHSVAYKLGLLDIPLVDQYALIFREWIRHFAPQHLQEAGLSKRINLTHDVDHIYQYAHPGSFFRAILNALFSRQPILGLTHEFKQLHTQLTSPQHGERYTAIFKLAESSLLHGFKSQFYFMSTLPGVHQQGYNPRAKIVQDAFRILFEQGHEIGFHPGYTTLNSLKNLKWEKQRLEDSLGSDVNVGRQHYLRFKVPDTWIHWEQAGLENDSTMGYADHEGFRCGTCYPFKPFDLIQNREINILETPLIVMDTTLIDYRKMPIEYAKLRIIELAKKCVEVGGVFTILWHNATLVGKYKDWGNMYLSVLPELKELITLTSGE